MQMPTKKHARYIGWPFASYYPLQPPAIATCADDVLPSALHIATRVKLWNHTEKQKENALVEKNTYSFVNTIKLFVRFILE